MLAVVVLVIVWGSPDRPGVARPSQIERVSPAPGETVVRQAALEVDVPGGYTVDIVVDGLPIPPDELFVVEGTGVHSWKPGPGKSLPEWAPGWHDVVVRWRTPAGLPDVGEYRWTFRTY